MADELLIDLSKAAHLLKGENRRKVYRWATRSRYRSWRVDMDVRQIHLGS